MKEARETEVILQVFRLEVIKIPEIKYSRLNKNSLLFSFYEQNASAIGNYSRLTYGNFITRGLKQMKFPVQLLNFQIAFRNALKRKYSLANVKKRENTSFARRLKIRNVF